MQPLAAAGEHPETPPAATAAPLSTTDQAVRAALARYGHIALEGPIGVGKSSLARRLADALGAELVLEQPQDNPFLERYYADPVGYAFQAQLAFLFQRIRQWQTLSQRDMFRALVVSDYTIEKDALFARLTLSDEEHRLYRQLYVQAVNHLPKPGLVLWLQADTPTLLERIRQRGIGMEQGIGADYLERLAGAYADLFRAAGETPVCIVDTNGFHPAADGADFAHLVAGLTAFDGRRGWIGQAGRAAPALR